MAFYMKNVFPVSYTHLDVYKRQALADMEKFSAGQRLITFQQYGSKNELINYVMLMFILSDFFSNNYMLIKLEAL